ncbi:MAG: hypothetical protein CL569_02695 [Alphaproteobacteria bacterium]|nr:hypothetical protein [Alphaproteobacteria bacterium]
MARDGQFTCGTLEALMSRPSGSLSPAKGIACAIAGGALLTLNDGVMKWLTGGYPTGEILFVRGAFAFIPILYLAWRAGGRHALRIRSLGAQSGRATCLIVSAFLYVTALKYLPLADVVAVTFMVPIIVTALAPPILGEHVGWRCWAAVIVGFLGILLLVRPTGEALQIAIMLPLGSATASAFRDIITRRISASESSTATVAFTNGAVMLAGLVTLPLGWIVPSWDDIGLMAIGGIMFGTAHFLYIESLRLTEAVLVTPFRYFNMVWAILFGFLVWGDFPDVWIFVGTTLIIGSGLYVMSREARHRQESGPAR